MGKDKCCVSHCENRKGCPEHWIIRSQVDQLKFHSFPSDPNLRRKWEQMIRKALDKAKFTAADHKVVCSNHFEYGKPTDVSPFPTCFLTKSDMQLKKSPYKRRKIKRENVDASLKRSAPEDSTEHEIYSEESTMKISMHFAQITRESDVKVFTGIKDPKTFKFIFEQLSVNARNMNYWRGEKLTPSEIGFGERKGPQRKLSLEQEFLLTLMKLRMGLLIEDLAWRFDVSAGLTSQIFFTWIRLISLDLRFMIMWPSRRDIRQNLPEMFQKHFPKCVGIIDCSEFFVETPSSLEHQATLWSEYKHHCTVKVLIAITPNGAISYLSPAYGGRSSDKFIVQDSDFLERLRPGDQLMADRGFKIDDILAFRQCSLAIPPSKKSDVQMTEKNVRKTSRVANARIYVENAIGRVKYFRILRMELPILFLPIFNDIIICCCIFTNLSEPLCI